MSRLHDKDVTVGMPDGLMSFEHRRIWEKFFAALGVKTLSSGKTTNDIIRYGVSLCSNETCLPVKVFAGHAASLCGRADCIFVPRCMSVCKGEKSCPKLCGLPDVVRLSLKNKAPVTGVTVDLDKSVKESGKSLSALSETIGRNKHSVESAFLRIAVPGLAAENSPNAFIPEFNRARERPVIAVLGHPYMIFDELLSMGLIKKLTSAGYRVLTPYDIKRSVRRANACPFAGRSFYETGLDILGAFNVFRKMDIVAGMVYLTPFACGVDSIAAEFVERGIREEPRKPFLKLTVDEHSGESGFDTRLEAFLDMLPAGSLNEKRQSI